MHHDQFVKCSLGAGNDILLPVQTQATKQNGHPIRLKIIFVIISPSAKQAKVIHRDAQEG